MPIQLKKPIVVRLTPISRNQADIVENTSRNGSPAEKPRNSMPITRGCKYSFADASQEPVDALAFCAEVFSLPRALAMVDSIVDAQWCMI